MTSEIFMYQTEQSRNKSVSTVKDCLFEGNELHRKVEKILVKTVSSEDRHSWCSCLYVWNDQTVDFCIRANNIVQCKFVEKAN